MCVAIVKPADKVLTEETLRLCFKQNPDGCGFAYVDSSNCIQIFKSMDFEPFYAAYSDATSENNSPFLIHFRIKTHGTKDIFNCHPFQVDDDIVFIHNGVINAVPDCPDKLKSDTQMFNETILQKLPVGWFDNDGIKTMIEHYISFSKLAVLHRRNGGEIKIYNEGKGTWKNGVWFSNMLWEPRETYYSKSKAITHADNCLECRKDIKGNHYADLHNVSFCSWGCESAFKKNARKWRNKCDQCGVKMTYILIDNEKGEFEYCSQACKEKHQKGLNEIVYPQLQLVHTPDIDEDVVVQCVWCGEWMHNSECVGFDGFFNSVQTEFICATCVGEAISAGLLQDSPELQLAVKKILYPAAYANA